eukprot:m.190202 g.190202  ORF g.190202 m.190202 type:complete len:515 (+) comp18546_c0_seq2:69-1613(+)
MVGYSRRGTFLMLITICVHKQSVWSTDSVSSPSNFWDLVPGPLRWGTCSIRKEALDADNLLEILQQNDGRREDTSAGTNQDYTIVSMRDHAYRAGVAAAKKARNAFVDISNMWQRTKGHQRESQTDTPEAANAAENECPPLEIIGQHIAMSVVPFVVSEHLRAKVLPKKPLVISLVGPPGVGKTEFETRLRRSLFTDAGINGDNAGTHVVSGVDYRDANEANTIEMVKDIAKQVQMCPQSLVVLDEVQFMHAGTMDYLVDVLGYRQPVTIAGVGTVDFRRSIFILTSNVGSSEIMHLVENNDDIKNRSTMTYSMFADLLKQKLQEKEYWIAYKNRVDYFVPFLPMDVESVKLAVQQHLVKYSCEMKRDSMRTLAAPRPLNADSKKRTKQKFLVRKVEWESGVLDTLARVVIPLPSVPNDEGAVLGPFAADGLSGIRSLLVVNIFAPVQNTLRHLCDGSNRGGAHELCGVEGIVQVTVKLAPSTDRSALMQISVENFKAGATFSKQRASSHRSEL